MDAFVSGLGFVVVFASLYFEVFLLISVFEKKKNVPHIDHEYTPKVTVIVPVFNEERTIEGTLASLLALDYPKELLSIIVVNDGSTDGTEETLKKFADDAQIKVFSKPNGGKYTALNFGIERAEGDFVGCLDADSFVERHALKKIMARFADPRVMAVTPSMVIDSPKGIVRRMQKAEYSYGNFIRKAFSLIGAIHITPGPFSFFRKVVFEKIGLYKHAHNTEDMEMAMRMQKNKMHIANASDALVYTVGPGSVKKLYKQRVRWVSGFIGNLIDYREMLFSKQFGDLGLLILPFSVFGIIVTFIFIMITVYSWCKVLWKAFIEYSIVGFTTPTWHFDPFYINTSILSILSLMLASIIIALVIYGERSATGKWRVSINIFYFMFIYSFIAPFWLLKSIYNNVMRKEASWR